MLADMLKTPNGRICLTCGTPLLGRQMRYCRAKCINKKIDSLLLNERMRFNGQVRKFCKTCGKELEPHKLVYCSPKCRSSDVMVQNWKTERFAEIVRDERIRKLADPSSGFGWASQWTRPDSAINAIWNEGDHKKLMSALAVSRNFNPDDSFGKRGGRGQKGHYKSDKVPGGEIFYASVWEHTAYEILDADDRVRSYQRFPRMIPFEYNGKCIWTFPDLLVIYTDNKKRMLEIKGDQYLKHPKTRAKLRQTAQYSKSIGGLLPYKVWFSKHLGLTQRGYRRKLNLIKAAQRESLKLTQEVTSEDLRNSADYEDHEIVPPTYKSLMSGEVVAEPNKVRSESCDL